MNLELYINNQLCDTGNPAEQNIILKRVFIKPSEMSTKDAQKSYDITLPPTPVNNEIFGHVNIEEVKNKFSAYPDAKLYVDGVLILDGKFRLSGIDRNGYHGNLGVPAPLTAKDVFGNTMMNQAGKWLIDFKGLEDITTYNNKENSECIFPFVLYGLLPKEKRAGYYSSKDMYDDTVKFEPQHFPPSVNCMQMLGKIFDNAKYTLRGNALDDPRLNSLYVSYKNDEAYNMPFWNNKIHITGNWTNYDEQAVEERGLKQEKADGYNTHYTVNLFNSSMKPVTIEEDTMKVVTQSDNKTTTEFIIPQEGLYRIVFKAKINLGTGAENGLYKGFNPNYVVIEPRTKFSNTPMKFHFQEKRFEIKLLRNVDDFNQQTMHNIFYKNNIDQKRGDKNCIFPSKGNVNFIDPYNSRNVVCGFSWGSDFYNYTNDRLTLNPVIGSTYKHNPMAIKHGMSWESREEEYQPISAVKSDLYVYSDGNETNNREYAVDMINAPSTYTSMTDDYMNGEGQVAQIVWLDKNDRLSIVSTSDESWQFNSDEKPDNYGWLRHTVEFDLVVEPFQETDIWLTSKMDMRGYSIDTIDWDIKDYSLDNKIDLIRFLPSDTKVNDWIENFCKAFNLTLTNVGNDIFELNLKKTEEIKRTSQIIDLDKKTSVWQASNQPLDVPYVYELGFEVDVAEQGYVETMKRDKDKNNMLIVNSGETGIGQYYTGNYDINNRLEHKSSFSYCWYKPLYKKTGSEKELFATIPIISDKEAWEKDYDYEEMNGKMYTDKNQRFWYKGELKNITLKTMNIETLLVTDIYDDGVNKMKLNYKEDNTNSIAHNYFLLLTNDRCYTVVNCYLTPDEYRNLADSKIRFNGDLYVIAEIDGYDPIGNKSATLKLLKTIG